MNQLLAGIANLRAAPRLWQVRNAHIPEMPESGSEGPLIVGRHLENATEDRFNMLVPNFRMLIRNFWFLTYHLHHITLFRTLWPLLNMPRSIMSIVVFTFDGRADRAVPEDHMALVAEASFRRAKKHPKPPKVRALLATAFVLSH
jgi:hypothetical protein